MIHRWKCKDAPIAIDRTTGTYSKVIKWLVVRVWTDREMIISDTARSLRGAKEQAELIVLE